MPEESGEIVSAKESERKRGREIEKERERKAESELGISHAAISQTTSTNEGGIRGHT